MYFKIVFKWVKLRVAGNCWGHRRSELDSCSLIPEYTRPRPIRFGTTMDDYREVFADFKVGVLLSQLRIGQFQNVFKWVKVRV
jgi:hypothetical protein